MLKGTEMKQRDKNKQEEALWCFETEGVMHRLSISPADKQTDGSVIMT